MCGHFIQKNAALHTARNSMNASGHIACLTSRELWPDRSLDLTHCNVYLRSTLKENLCLNNLNSVQELNGNVQY
jgi:hypothetical protein